jgi:hypothetical protein
MLCTHASAAVHRGDGARAHCDQSQACIFTGKHGLYQLLLPGVRVSHTCAHLSAEPRLHAHFPRGGMPGSTDSVSVKWFSVHQLPTARLSGRGRFCRLSRQKDETESCRVRLPLLRPASRDAPCSVPAPRNSAATTHINPRMSRTVIAQCTFART